jgi:hypothetical protein
VFNFDMRRVAASKKAAAKKRSAASQAAAAAVEAELATARAFETPRARAVGVALLLVSQTGLFVLCCQSNSARASAWTLVWSLVLIFQHGWVLAPGRVGTATARALTYACSLLVVTLPHLPVCKSGLGRATGAAQGAASMLTVMRAFQTLHRIEEGDPKWKKANGRWRRFYQGCGLSWHDLDEGRARALAPGAECSAHTQAVLYRLLSYLVLMVVPAAAISWLPTPHAILSLHMLSRCLLMCGTLVAAFNVFDSAYLCLMSAVNGIAVTSIMKGTFWSAKTVGDIWLGWNLPVQRLLSRGVYLPLRKRGVSRSLSRFAVFFISGMGHVYPCVVCGLTHTQITFMMLFFVAQVALITFENAVGLRSGVWCIGIEILLSPLFVLPVMMFTDPALVGLQLQLTTFTV